jgi:hypothetical protein
MTDQPPSLILKGRTISPALFTKGYSLGGGPCSCSSTCCEGGVYVDVRERENILAHRELIRRHMDETQSQDDRTWFEIDEHDDPDYLSGRCVGTAVINEKCAFLDRYGRCSIQVATTEEGPGRWALKPFYCILYPIEITNNVVNVDPMLQDEQSCCTVGAPFDIPVFEACNDELEHVLGKDGLHALREHYHRFYHPDRKAI